MVKTVWFDIPLSFLIGMLIAAAAADGLRRSPSLLGNQYFLAAVLFELLFFIPLGAYLYAFHPDWSVMYFFDPGALSASSRVWLGAAALSSYLAATVAGFALAAWLVRADNMKAAVLVMACIGAALAIFSLFTIRQLTQVGTFAEWTALPRTTTALYYSRVGWIIALDAAVAGWVLATLFRSFSREREAF